MSAAASCLNSGLFNPSPPMPVQTDCTQGLNAAYWGTQEIPRKGPQRQRSVADAMLTRATFEQSNTTISTGIDFLKKSYVFADSTVDTFLEHHRATRTVLRQAIDPLKVAFGPDKMLSLEISKDEDGSETLYAIAFWPGDAVSASHALHRFLETWWLHRMSAATIDLAFAYRLV